MVKAGKNSIPIELRWGNLKESLKRFEEDLSKSSSKISSMFGADFSKNLAAAFSSSPISSVIDTKIQKPLLDAVATMLDGSSMLFNDAAKWSAIVASSMGAGIVNAESAAKARDFIREVSEQSKQVGVSVSLMLRLIYDSAIQEAKRSGKSMNDAMQSILSSGDMKSQVAESLKDMRTSMIFLEQSSGVAASQIQSIFNIMAEKSGKSFTEINTDVEKVFGKLQTLSKSYGVSMEEVANLYLTALKKSNDVGKAMEDTAKKADKTYKLQLEDVTDLDTAWKFAGQTLVKWLAPLVLLKIGWDAVSNAIKNATILTNMYGMTAKAALGTVQSIMRMSTKGFLDYEVVGNTVVMLGNFNKSLIDIDKSSGKLSSDSEKLVTSIVKVSAVTGASIESLTQLTNTMISVFRLSRDEMTAFAQQLGSYTGLTSTEVNNVTVALRDYGDELIRINGAEGRKMLRENRAEILGSMANLSTAAKVLGVEQKDMLKLQLELLNRTNIDKFQRLGITNMSKYTKMFLGSTDEQLAALTEIGQKMSEAYGGKDSEWVEKAMRGMNLDRVLAVKLEEAQLRKQEILDLNKTVDLNKRYEESLSNVSTFMTTIKRELAVMMSEVIVPALKPLAVIWNWLMKYPAVMKAIVASIIALTIAVTAFNVVAWACPLTWIGALIVGVIAGIVLLIVYWDEVVKSFKLAGSHFVTVGKWIIEIWDEVVKSFKLAGSHFATVGRTTMPILKAIGDTILKSILAPTNSVVAVVKMLWTLFNAIVHWEWAGFGAKMRAIIMNMFPEWIQTLINNWIGGSKEVPKAAVAGASVSNTGNVVAPALASGTDRVLQTGVAVVHKDEAVVPAGTIGEINKNIAILVELLKMYIPSIATNTRGGSVNDYLMSMGAVSGKV